MLNTLHNFLIQLLQFKAFCLCWLWSFVRVDDYFLLIWYCTSFKLSSHERNLSMRKKVTENKIIPKIYLQIGMNFKNERSRKRVEYLWFTWAGLHIVSNVKVIPGQLVNSISMINKWTNLYIFTYPLKQFLILWH